MMGIQNVAAIFCIPLIPYCWDTKYGSHILYPLKDQRRDTEYGRHTEYGVPDPFHKRLLESRRDQPGTLHLFVIGWLGSVDA